MANLRRPALRLALALTLAAALIVEVHTLVQSLSAHQRLQARAAERLRALVQELRLPVARLLAPGGVAAREAAADAVAAAVPGATVELFDAPTGQRLLVLGEPVRVAHWAAVDSLEAPGAAGVVVVGPFVDAAPVLLAYVLFATPTGRVVLRVARPADDLQADLSERRGVLFAHALSLALVLLVALVALLGPGRADVPPQGALSAYEAALGHMREREQRRSDEHAAERLRLERAMREKEALARAGELTSGMAHEVRNGLGTILGYARLLERSGLSTDDQAAASAIRDECETLAGVVRRFVEYVRVEELKLSACDLRQTLARVAARETRGRAGAAVELCPGPEVELRADEELLERAFENVVRNAREAAGGQGRVEVELRDEGAWVEVRVRDDGPGLGPQGSSRLRPFHSAKPGGLGLGLPLSAKLVRLHGGELRFVDNLPRGLEVVLRLPRDVTVSNIPTADDSDASAHETL